MTVREILDGRRDQFIPVLACALYWGSALIVPGAFAAWFVALVLLAAGVFMSQRYLRTALTLWIDKSKSFRQDGVAGVYGITLIGLGSVYSGVFRFTWLAAGSPPEWLGTHISNFGSTIMAGGFFLMYLSPDAARGVLRPMNSLMLIFMMVAGLAGAYYLGRTTTAGDVVDWGLVETNGVARPMCGPDYPVWGTERKTAHGPDSPYRRIVIARYCFKTPQEAIDAGFKMVTGS